MKAWELIVLIFGFAIIYLFISAFVSSGSPFMLFGSSIGAYMVLIILEKKYYHYFNPELAWASLVIFQALILTYICIFAPIHPLDISFYMGIGFFLYCLAELYYRYKDPSRC